ERLAGAFADGARGGPALLVGMDTPQAGPGLLALALTALLADGTDAVLGPATDGGWWTAGLRRPDGATCEAAFLSVPMSTSRTWAEQHRRLLSLGLAVTDLPELRDVDDIDDAMTVAGQCPPGSAFAAA